jgi:hypothetical protein
MEKQYYLYDENLMYLSTNFYIEKPNNGVDFYPTIELEFAKVDLENNVWIDIREI